MRELRDLRPLREEVEALFHPGDSREPPRTGIEAEALPVRSDDGAPVPPRPRGAGGPGTLPILRAVARRRGWNEEDTPSGLPRFVLPAGGMVSFEPGGQIEYSSPPSAHLPTLHDTLIRVWGALETALAAEGILLLARGVDPRTPVSRAELVVEGERYPRQRAHYDRRGPLGRVMMLQSAALHVNVDLGRRPLEAWRAANRLAPLLVALFANSPRRCGASVPHRSHRAALWRRLDPTRTGLFDPPEGEARDPIQAYLDFALDAEAFLLGPRDRSARPFREWWRAGTVGVDEFRRHLTTLFPEVRPRGYLEIRSIDALPARWCTVAGAVVTSLIHGPGAREALLNRIPRATPDRLERAGRLGIGDRELLQEVRWLRDRVQDGLRELGPAVSDPSLQRTVTAFFDVFPRRGLDPGAAPESWMGS